MPRGVHQVVLTGGGARNPTLVEAIRRALAPLPVTGAEALGMDPGAREAAAFAVLAWAHFHEVPANEPSATGADGPRILGCLTPAPARTFRRAPDRPMSARRKRRSPAPESRLEGSSSPEAPAGEGGERPRRPPLLAVGIAVVAVQLLLTVPAFIPAPHSGGDNATYLSLAYALLEHGSYTEVFDPAGLPHTKYPPVFPSILAVWILLGARTWVALKTVPMLFTTVAIALTYLWVAGRRGPWFAAAVALLLAISSAVIDASHWVLSEPPFLAFTMLALWAFDRAALRDPRSDGQQRGDLAGNAHVSAWLFALGGAAAVLAFFTRSAGFPLLLAVLGWLAWRREHRALITLGVGSGGLALLWWLRARAVPGSADYAAEFWMVNPYDPALGDVGLAGLAGRVVGNTVGYVTRYLPGGIVGMQGGWVALLGVLLVGFALWGWGRRLVKGPGVAELFVPLYTGLIVLWPEVWSGDRFALSLYPLFFFYAGEAVLEGGRRLGAGRALPVALVLLGVGLPAAVGWVRWLPVARGCAESVRAAGPWSCWGPDVEEFALAAVWSGTALPQGSAVLTRQPSIFYVLSGLPSRTFPFSEEPGVLRDEATALGARFLLLDKWDRQAEFFPARAVTTLPDAFCGIASFPAGTNLVGIVEVEQGDAGEEPDEVVRLEPCPSSMLTSDILPSRSRLFPVSHTTLVARLREAIKDRQRNPEGEMVEVSVLPETVVLEEPFQEWNAPVGCAFPQQRHETSPRRDRVLDRAVDDAPTHRRPAQARLEYGAVEEPPSRARG